MRIKSAHIFRMENKYTYLFGPVPSRRLGRSLGVDLIPVKTCTMNCTYCQLGETPCTLSERAEYVPLQDVLNELDRWNKSDGNADHITLAGSGEPTLHTRFGDVFRWVRDHTDIQSVLLTNGSLLYDPDVRAGASRADKVKVTMSAWDEESFQKIHRPVKGISFDLLVQGEVAFREEYSGELSVEVFVVDGVNSAIENMEQIAKILERINPDHIDLNTAVRPPAEKSVRAVPEERMKELAKICGPKGRVTAAYTNPSVQVPKLNIDIVSGLIRRHPATCEQLAKQFDVAERELFRMLQQLVEDGTLHPEVRDAEHYYVHRESYSAATETVLDSRDSAIEN